MPWNYWMLPALAGLSSKWWKLIHWFINQSAQATNSKEWRCPTARTHLNQAWSNVRQKEGDKLVIDMVFSWTYREGETYHLGRCWDLKNDFWTLPETIVLLWCTKWEDTVKNSENKQRTQGSGKTFQELKTK